MSAVTDCVFCPANWDNLDMVAEPVNGIAIINPLDPVTQGHVLVISATHTDKACCDPQVAADLMYVAAEYVGRYVAHSDANIITSMGAPATQTVMHTHVHVVPRRENDGLPLPWTPQHELKRLRAIRAMQQINQESSFRDHASTGLFQQRDSVGYGGAVQPLDPGQPVPIVGLGTDAVLHGTEIYWPTALAEGLDYTDD